MLRAVDIENGGLSGTKILRVHKDIESEYERTRLQGGEVLLSVMGTIGRTILVRKEWVDWNVNRALAVIRLNPRVLPEFFYQWLRSPEMQNQLTKDSIGTAQLRINLSNFRKYSVPVPSIDRQAEIVTSIQLVEKAQSLVSEHVIRLAYLLQSFVNLI
jgi:type I restriction enzyme S subunit